MLTMGKTVVLIDGPNIYYATRALGFRIDWGRFRDYFSKKYNILRLYYYTALDFEAESNPIVRMTDWLAYNGYVVRSKPLKVRGESHKGNMDVELAVDALTLVGTYDHAIILSGDGDLRSLVEALEFKGIRVTVIQTKQGEQTGIASELIMQADEFIDLKDLQAEIEDTRSRESNGSSTE